MQTRRKALITGGLGFVGRYMTDALIKQGYHITCVDIKKHPDDRRVGDVHYVTEDARKFFQVNKTSYDLVVHLAAVIGGRAMIEGNPLALAVDLELDAAMFQWAVATRQPHVVYYSSSAVYPTFIQNGRPPRLSVETSAATFNERAIGVPDMSYGWAKLTGEYLAQFARENGVTVSIFRPFSGYGHDQSLDYPFPSFIARARAHANPFEIWGDGTQVRDWIHIKDVVDATIVFAKQRFNGVVNLGTGRPTSFIQLRNLVCEAAGHKAYETKFHLDAPAGVMYRVADTTAMSTVYTPKITLEQGIDDALRHKDK